MDSFNSQFLYSVLIIALGYILKRTNLIKEQDGEGLARIIFNLTLPSLLIVTFHDIEIDSSLILLIVIAIVYGLIQAALGLFLFKNEEKRTKGMLSMMAPGFNIGLFAFPLVEAIWGKEGLKYFGMFDFGNALIVFGVIYVIGSIYSDAGERKDLKHVVGKVTKSVPLITYVTVCTLNFTGVTIPSVILQVSETISVANMPLSLLLLGIYLNFSFAKGSSRQIIKLLSLRYVVGLGIGILLFMFLPFESMFKYTVLIALILPMSASVLPYAVEFDYDRKFVGTVSNITIIVSFFLLWGVGTLLI
ncbi:AEC family transporter [Pontibacillus yanchengensis]|uniref:Malonate transporter n=1 Tax=Pontibacillus yanchengensis Y32 TaxID=1385514 RepID=A0A0A2T9X2_9BACI|nr:AEC family transporter [Pontibacillus yanchengensis]KGP72632.1 malonate transporter [Pontibacillus yanchengensis Y32]